MTKRETIVGIQRVNNFLLSNSVSCARRYSSVVRHAGGIQHLLQIVMENKNSSLICDAAVFVIHTIKPANDPFPCDTRVSGKQIAKYPKIFMMAIHPISQDLARTLSCRGRVGATLPAPMAQWLCHRLMRWWVLGSHLGTGSNPERVVKDPNR